ncbi:MAG: hydroxyisourate hydrolase [Bacteroidetes bacterium]|nr:hydroxyisourate hydrolase [Bacteroidota bacterium]
MSQLTTHILDTTIGKPAQGVHIQLEQNKSGQWLPLAYGKTNSDGRISNLLPAEKILDTGVYRLIFDTGSYFKSQNSKSFYPSVSIEFEITDASHYHVPLLLNPFGYSTYRGS